MPKPKINYTPYLEDAETVIFMGNSGITNDNTIDFTFNIAPEEPNPKGDLFAYMKEQIKEYQKFYDFLEILKNFDWDYDFYWGEGDLLIIVSVSFNHPLFKHLNLK